MTKTTKIILSVVVAIALLVVGYVIGNNSNKLGATSSSTVNVSQSASSTLAIGSPTKTGCIAIGDSATSTITVYITASGSTISATTTKPSICR